MKNSKQISCRDFSAQTSFAICFFPTDHSLLHWDQVLNALIFLRKHPTPKKKKKKIILVEVVFNWYFFFLENFQSWEFEPGHFTNVFCMVSYPQKHFIRSILK